MIFIFQFKEAKQKKERKGKIDDRNRKNPIGDCDWRANA